MGDKAGGWAAAEAARGELVAAAEMVMVVARVEAARVVESTARVVARVEAARVVESTARVVESMAGVESMARVEPAAPAQGRS